LGSLSTVNISPDGEALLQLNSVDSMFVDFDPLPSVPGSQPSSPSLPHHLTELRNQSSKLSKRPKKVLWNHSPSESVESDSNEFHAQTQQYRRLNHSGAKAHSSWAHQKALKVDVQAPEFKHNDIHLTIFQTKATGDNPHAEFDPHDLRRVRCLACATWVIMRALYEVRRWKEHRNSPRCQSQQQHGLVNKSIQNFFSSSPTVAALSNICNYPCPGLERERNPRISSYLKRSMAVSGGAPSRTNIAHVLFGVDAAYGLLSDTDKKMVLRQEESLFQWKNSRAVGAVFSTKCSNDVAGRQGDGELLPCVQCHDLLKLHTFQVALNKCMPADANMKYTPNNRRDPEVGDIYLKVKGILDLVETVCAFT
jgi:hypothetical protein